MPALLVYETLRNGNNPRNENSYEGNQLSEDDVHNSSKSPRRAIKIVALATVKFRQNVVALIVTNLHLLF